MGIYNRKYNTVFKLVITAIASILVFAIISILIFKFLIYPKMESEIVREAINKIDENKIDVLVFANDIKKGTKIRKDDLKKIFSDKFNLPADHFLLESDVLGKTLRIDVNKNTLIQSSIILNESKDTSDDIREYEIVYVNVPDHIQTGDFVDIKIRGLKDITDYVVITKNKVINISEGRDKLYLQLNKSENHYLRVAYIDSLYNEKEVYMAKYVDSYNQKESEVDYMIDVRIELLVEENENNFEEFIKEIKDEKEKRGKKNNEVSEEKEVMSAND